MADVVFALFLLVGFWCISLVIDYIMIPFYVLMRYSGESSVDAQEEMTWFHDADQTDESADGPVILTADGAGQ